MEHYKNLGGDSGVSSYEISSSSIKIKFKDTAAIYVYTYTRPGQLHVERMKELAIAGHGLQAYINKHRSSARYDHKE